MALSAVADKISVWGDRKAIQCTLTFSGSYTTGGETLTNSQVGLNVVEQIIPCGGAVNAGRTLDYPAAGNVTLPLVPKVQLFTSNGAAGAAAGLAEHPAGAYTATLTGKFIVVGF